MIFFKHSGNSAGSEIYSPVSDSNHEQTEEPEDTEEETEEGK